MAAAADFRLRHAVAAFSPPVSGSRRQPRFRAIRLIAALPCHFFEYVSSIQF